MLLSLWEVLGLGSSEVTMETALELSRGSSFSFPCQPSVATVKKCLLCLWRPWHRCWLTCCRSPLYPTFLFDNEGDNLSQDEPVWAGGQRHARTGSECHPTEVWISHKYLSRPPTRYGLLLHGGALFCHQKRRSLDT